MPGEIPLIFDPVLPQSGFFAFLPGIKIQMPDSPAPKKGRKSKDLRL
jgi:hypothetical protein